MKRITLAFTTTVTVEVRELPARSGRWLKPIEVARDEDWQEYEAPPPTTREVVRQVRQHLNDSRIGVGSSDVSWDRDNMKVTGGRVVRRKTRA